MTQSAVEQQLAEARVAVGILVLELEGAGLLDQTAHPQLWEAVNRLFHVLRTAVEWKAHAPAAPGSAGPTSPATESIPLHQGSVGETASVAPQRKHPGRKQTEEPMWHSLDSLFAAVEVTDKQGKKCR